MVLPQEQHIALPSIFFHLTITFSSTLARDSMIVVVLLDLPAHEHGHLLTLGLSTLVGTELALGHLESPLFLSDLNNNGERWRTLVR